MDRWLRSFVYVSETLLKHPGTRVELWCLVAAACLVCAAVISKAGKAMGFARCSLGLCLLTSLVSGALVMAGVTAVRVFLPDGGALYWGGAAAAVSVALVVPLLLLVHKGNYLTALMTWLIGAGAAAGVVMMISAGIDAVSSGARNADKSRDHREKVEQILE